MISERDIQKPPAYRFLLRFGRPLGLRWVGDYELGIIFRLERYYDVRGPGFFWINPLTERIQSVTSIAPDFVSTPIPAIQTKDALQIGFSLALAYLCDPRAVSRERAAMVVKWSREIRRAIVTDNVQRAFQAVVPKFYAEQICRGEVFKPLEDGVLQVLTERLETLALKPMFGMVREVTVPLVLQSRFEAVVQRQVNIDAISQYEPYELSQAMRTEALEAIKAMGGGKQYLNLPDFTDIVTPPQDETQSPPRQIARPAATPDQAISPGSLPTAIQPAPPRRQPKSRL